MHPACTHIFAEFPQKILQKIIFAEGCQVLTFLLWQAAKSSRQVENIYEVSTVNKPSVTLSACLLRHKFKRYHKIFTDFLWIFN